jgi:pimeloyl-ACP methyl ester carboxylesterase
VQVRRVDVGGYQLSAHVRDGVGVPVVFVSGLGESHGAWQPVLDALPDSVRAITYDRAGIGDSDPYPPPQRAAVAYRQAAGDLRNLLHSLDVTAPWLLVGHSYGGCIIRSLADDYPADVAGVVLVDPSVAELSLPDDLEQYFGEDDGDGTRYEGKSEHYCQIDNRIGAAQLRAENLPVVPSVVLTRARNTWNEPMPAVVDDYWYTEHEALVDKLDAWHIVAATAGHRIHEDEPALVACAIAAVGEAVAGGSSQLEGDAIEALGGCLQRVPTA